MNHENVYKLCQQTQFFKKFGKFREETREKSGGQHFNK
jgi:hypothetical protein